AKAALAATGPQAGRQFQTTSPPNPCYYSVWVDPKDATELDGKAYEAAYDCPSGTWRFSVNTFDQWQDSQLDGYTIPIDADDDPATGCGGFEFLLAGAFVNGGLTAALFSTPTCSTLSKVANAAISRDSSATVALSVPNAAL